MHEHFIEKAINEAEVSPLEWWWISFADGDLPVGSQFLGVALVQAHGFGLAMLRTHTLKINPGGSVHGHPIPERMGDPPEAMRDRLVSDKAELDRLVTEWTGAGIMTTAEAEAKGLM